MIVNKRDYEHSINTGIKTTEKLYTRAAGEKNGLFKRISLKDRELGESAAVSDYAENSRSVG